MTRGIRYFWILLFWGLLSGCVTTVEGPNQKPASTEKRVKAQLDLARGYLAQGNLSNARTPLEKALSIDPTSSEAHVLMAILLQGESEYEKAEKEYRAALRYDRDNAQVLNNYGSFLYSMGRYSEALKTLRRAVQDDGYPGRAQAFENFGLVQMKLGDAAAAEKSFRRALRLNSTQRRSMLELAQIYFDQGKTNLALNYYDNFLQLARQTPRSLWLGIQMAREIGDENRVSSYALALRNLFPDSAEYRLYQDSLE